MRAFAAAANIHRRYAAVLSAFLIIGLAVCVLVLYSSAAHADWAKCADEGGECVLPGAGAEHYLVRYGAQGSYFVSDIEGAKVFACSNGIFGDPLNGASKTCEYMLVPENYNMPTAAQSKAWKYCAAEKQTCNLPSDGKTYRVAFGVFDDGQDKPKAFIYNYASGPIPCDDTHFATALSWHKETDIALNRQKFCYYYVDSVPYQSTSIQLSFADCATEDNKCSFPDPGSEMKLYRFGAGNNWTYRAGFATELDCRRKDMNHAKDSGFLDPLDDAKKACQVAEMPPSIGSATGSWHFVAGCSGGACASFQHAITVGVTGSRSKTVTDQWSQEVAIEVSKELTYPTGKTQGKVSFKVAHQQSTAVQETLSRQVTESKAATCTGAGADRMEMWQWGVDVDELCYVSTGHCKSTVLPYEFLCVANPASGYKPICVPGDCGDAQCTVCSGQ
jgi:hypothetical protein